ncbi:MAG: hypothetical protein Q9M89_02775 [Persephonella sp.]|nr:hypothetical protein [Persephonella sp.]
MFANLADIKNGALNSSTQLPSEVVPSGNKTTLNPSFSSCVIIWISSFRLEKSLLSIKTAPPNFDIKPRKKFLQLLLWKQKQLETLIKG